MAASSGGCGLRALPFEVAGFSAIEAKATLKPSNPFCGVQMDGI